MKTIFVVTALSFALAAPGIASAGGSSWDLCKISQGQINMVLNGNWEQALFVGHGRNTNAGAGNGGEISYKGIICKTGLDGENDVNIDAAEGGNVATDPGNSSQDD